MDTALYASIFASLPAGTCVVDREGKILALNPALERLLGWGRDSLLGRPLAPFLEEKINDPAQALSWTVALSQALVHGQRTELGFPVEFEGEGAGHLSLAITSTIVPWYAAEGEQVGALLVCWDASQEGELARGRDRFLALISHELGSPLTNIAAAADRLALHMDPGDVQGWPLLQIVRAEAHRLRRLLGQFLAGVPAAGVPAAGVPAAGAARRQAEAQPEAGVVTLAPLLRRVARTFEVRGTEQSILVQVSPTLPFAWGDSDRIQEVLSNLVDNALRYAPAGSTVVLTAQEQGSEIEICVVDQGRGVARGQEEQIFEPGVRQGQGQGLGLPLARALVQSMGGRIWYERDPAGGGARFCFTLRLVARDEV
ncbi:MAG: PAS domain-containing sensor histidine kinase [Anaerolineae bacterium]